MKSNIKKIAILAALVATLGSVEAFGQARPGTNRSQVRPPAGRPPAGTRTATTRPTSSRPVAVVDVSYIFNNYAGFKQRMDNMKKQVQAYEATLKSRHEALAKDREKLNQYKPGTQQYKDTEQQLADKFASLQVDTQLKKKEFLENEARVYYDTYRLVEQVIQNYASRTGTGLVLRFSREPMNQNDRNSVLQGVNRAVVYHQGSLDITNDILNDLSRVSTGGSRASRPPARTPSRTPRQR